MTEQKSEVWFEELRKRYKAGEASVFILHGNVHDRIIQGKETISLSDYLKKELEATKEAIITFNIAKGLSFIEKGVACQQTAKSVHAQGQESDSELIETILLTQEKIGVIIEYAETLLLAGDPALQTPEDRKAVVMVHRWTQLPEFIDRDNIVILISETLSELSQKLVANPKVAIIEIPMPDLAKRRQAVEMTCPNVAVSSLDRYAEITSGLKCVQITGVLQGVQGVHLFQKNGDEEIEALIRSRKREIIKNECFGLLEIVEPKFGFEAVGGIPNVKQILTNVSKNMLEGNCSRVPMGIMIVGAQGTGKTYLVKAFAKECQATMAIIRNYRGQYVGLTEANQERIIKVAKSIENLILVFDEADRVIGNEEDGSGDPTSGRTKARWKEFMSDTSNRGKILFILMTNRPDLIDVDLKRAGRIDVKIPLFYPQTAEDVESVFKAVLVEAGTKYEIDLDEVFRTTVLSKMIDYSNADIAEINRIATNHAEGLNRPVRCTDYLDAIYDYFPTRDVNKIKFMELLAVFEASSKRLLPEKYANISPEALFEELETVRFKVGNKR